MICFLDSFEWKLRYADKKLLSVSLESGIILIQCLICYLDRFEWKLRYADKKLLSVSPESGIIQPNESQVRPNKENMCVSG